MTAANLAEQAPAGLFAVDRNCGLIEVNPAFVRLAGRPAVELVGRPFRDLLSASSQILYAVKVEPGLLQGASIHEVLLEVERPDAGRLPVLVSVSGASEEPIRHGVLYPAPERRAYELELISARKDAVAATAARDLLLREVYHRVKNNLQTVDSLLFIESRKLEDRRASLIFEAMRRRVFAMGLVHHQLTASSDLRTFDVATFLCELADHLEASADGELEVRVDASPMPVDLDVAVPLGLIVTELFTNALSQDPDRRMDFVSVSLQAAPDADIVLRVTEGGSRSADTFTTPGTPDLSIVRGLAAQVGGRLLGPTAGAPHIEVRLPTLMKAT